MNLVEFKAAWKKQSAPGMPSHVMNPTQSLVSFTTKLGDCIYDWLNGQGWVKQNEGVFAHAMEGYTFENKVAEDIVDKMQGLMAGMENLGLGLNMSTSNQDTVADMVYSSLNATFGKKSTAAWQRHFSAGTIRPQNQNEVIVQTGIESFMPEGIMREFFNPAQLAQESFGVDMDKSIPDMRTSITVGIMRFFNSATGKLFAKKMLNEPMVYFNTDEVMIYKTDSTDPEIPMVELNRDPDVVSVELTKIVALETNDTANVLTEDGYVRFGVGSANLMKLSIDSSKPAFASVNKTDLISDDAKLESVVISLSDGTTTEAFEFTVPTSISRMTYATNGPTTRRVANITWDAYIYNNTVTRAGAVNTLLAGVHANDVIVVTITANPMIDLRTGEFSVTGSMNLRAQNKTSATTAANAASTTELATISTRTLLSGKPDARFSEENLKKTNIGGEVLTQTFAYNMPVGRNYFMDYAFTQNVDSDRATAILMNIINYGIDARSIKLIKAKIEETKDKWTNIVPNGSYFQPGAGYVCSNRIKPVGHVGTFNCANFESMKELEKMADIHTAARIQLNGICMDIDAKSYINQQLVGGMMSYRVVTDVAFLGNILGIGRVHDRLKQSAPPLPANGTVNAVVQLDSGVTLEIIAVPFDSMKGFILGIPYMEADPESTLNFAINADMGSLVAHYQSDFNGLKHRLFTNVRELPIVCNPTGFSLQVTGMPAQLHMA